MRLRFPQDNTAFLYTEPGAPIRQPWMTQLTFYTDADLTTLADITDLDSVALTGSILFIGSDGLLPDFLGPADNTTVLWAKPPDDPAYPVVVKLDAYFDFRLNALIGGAGPTLDTLGELAAAVLDLQARVAVLEA